MRDESYLVLFVVLSGKSAWETPVSQSSAVIACPLVKLVAPAQRIPEPDLVEFFIVEDKMSGCASPPPKFAPMATNLFGCLFSEEL